MVLASSEYPDYFPQEWDLDFQPNTGILIIDNSLPEINSLPNVKSVKYVISQDKFTETLLTDAAINKIYDNLLYQVALRTIHELYEADVVVALNSVVFNGWVNSIDKATGNDVNSCIMSLQASRDDFLAINLSNVDPKACFKQLKGIGSSKLHGLSPIAPIININKEDRRFVSSYDVVDGVEETDNLAAMDWQDFENLIREIFEKEFVTSGGEVKITQASRDGGVDAIAFDPDPIRGGKIVIQAKRYTNVVGVSAVRDLYGTTVNEGATKGILVTTAEYGPDAYEFAKGKPLTLLNGGNLLHLLEKHGHKAKIDLIEAKKILAEQNN
jgi:restriction system protein